MSFLQKLFGKKSEETQVQEENFTAQAPEAQSNQPEAAENPVVSTPESREEDNTEAEQPEVVTGEENDRV